MKKDIWHYARTKLADQILTMFESGLSSALVFFAPRRMGKTEFLLKDIQPLAKAHGWQVFYFSFLDVGLDAKEAFTLELMTFAMEIGAIRQDKFHKHVKKVAGGIASLQGSIEFRDASQLQLTMKDIFTLLAKHNQKILLLLDEVQVLSANNKNKDFVAAFRTMLDIHKDIIKVIFTGSSREGLRRMFSKSDAPFFHFGQNLPFPELQKDFIEHLAHVFTKATNRKINTTKLWDSFNEMDKVPQLIRSLVERMILNPDLTMEQVKEELLHDLVADREYITIWQNASVLERYLLRAIVLGEEEFFSQDKRSHLAKQMGIEALTVSTVQSAIRTLQNKNTIGSLPERGAYYIDDPNFKSWILQSIIEDNYT